MVDQNLSELRQLRPQGPEIAAASGVQPTSQSSLYDPALALEFFRAAGTIEQKQATKPFFNENEKVGGLFSKGARMYLLLEGEVGLMLNRKFFGIVKQGEVFGELSVIADLPRSASAIAITDCRVVSLDSKQFQVALQKTPQFALMLLSIMVQRLRKSISTLGSSDPANSSAALERSHVFNKKMLVKLAKELNAQTPLTVSAGNVIVSTGAAAALMYFVLDGSVAISIGNRVVEHVGPGGFFGEMALLDKAPRAATVTAKTDCTLLSIGREDFLDLVKSKPDFSAALLKAIAVRMQHLAKQVARVQPQV